MNLLPATAPSPVDVVGLGSNALDLLGVIDGHPEPDTKAPLRRVRGPGGRHDRDGDGGVRAARPPRALRRQVRRRLLGAPRPAPPRARTASTCGHALRARGSVGHVSMMLIDARTRPPDRLLPPAARLRHPARGARPPGHHRRPAPPRGRRGSRGGRRTAVARALRGRDAGDDGRRARVDGTSARLAGRRSPRVQSPVRGPGHRARRAGRRPPRARRARPGPGGGHARSRGRPRGLEGGRDVRAPDSPYRWSTPTAPATSSTARARWASSGAGRFEWTLTFANAVAAMKCRTLGGRRGIPRLDDARRFLAERGHRELAAALWPGRHPGGAGRRRGDDPLLLAASKISPKSTQRSPSNFASCSCSIG